MTITNRSNIIDNKFILGCKNKAVENMILKIYLEKSEEGGYTVTVPSLPGCISEGDTKEEAIKNIKEAIELYLKPDEEISHNPNLEELELAI